MAPGYTEYVKLKESENMVEAGGYFDLYPCPSEQELNLPCEISSLYQEDREIPLPPETRNLGPRS